MKIVDPIIEPYSIVIDADNFTVGVEKEYEDKKAGGTYTVQQGQTFHSTMESAIKRIIKHKLNDSEEVIDLEEYLRRYKKMFSEFGTKFAGLEKLPKEQIED